MGSVLFSPRSWCTEDFVCALQEWSLFSPVLWKSCNQILLTFKARFSGDSSSHCQTPRLGCLMWGSELSLQWENFCGIIIFQFVVCPPNGYGISFYHDCFPPTILLWPLCLWTLDIFFGRFQHFFVDGCSAVSCDSGVLIRRDEHTSFYSTTFSLPL